MFNEASLLQELDFKAVRSSGSGGQHVNKVSSKFELIFNLKESLVFNENKKERLENKLKNRLSKEGVIILSCDESRSHHKNKALVIKRFLELIRASLIVPKKRISTKIPKSVIRKRLKNKKFHSDKKTKRKRPDID
jgi:ribosome-associated protein